MDGPLADASGHLCTTVWLRAENHRNHCCFPLQLSCTVYSGKTGSWFSLSDILDWLKCKERLDCIAAAQGLSTVTHENILNVQNAGEVGFLIQGNPYFHIDLLPEATLAVQTLDLLQFTNSMQQWTFKICPAESC